MVGCKLLYSSQLKARQNENVLSVYMPKFPIGWKNRYCAHSL